MEWFKTNCKTWASVGGGKQNLCLKAMKNRNGNLPMMPKYLLKLSSLCLRFSTFIKVVVDLWELGALSFELRQRPFRHTNLVFINWHLDYMHVMKQDKNEKEIMPEDFTSFVITLWSIWIHKNKVVFEGVSPNAVAVIEAAFGSQPDHKKAVKYKYSYIGSPHQNAGVQNMAQYS
ncbi:hypothetical protein GOBAR_AA17489 [Gossypium barbadense]|uniref:Uncharacterized protein n=1 Tax=Gossypium barbadense TaxID=3634 RepID=A0A2P5XIK4_GOSBA|nr:hypothetical protein GOBAR_AA17489 [Gossypium barbadense]